MEKLVYFLSAVQREKETVMCRFVDFEVPLGCKQTRKNCVDDHASSTPARTRAKISFANSRLTWKGWRLKCRSWIKKPRKTSLLTSQHWRKTGTGLAHSFLLPAAQRLGHQFLVTTITSFWEPIVLILTSSTIDKKLENFEFIFKFKIAISFEFIFEIFCKFRVYLRGFCHFWVFCQRQMKSLLGYRNINQG